MPRAREVCCSGGTDAPNLGASSAAHVPLRRMMDAVDPPLLDVAGRTLRCVVGVINVGDVRLRWIGHQLRAGCEIQVDAHVSVVEAHQVAVAAEHALLHALPRLSAALCTRIRRPLRPQKITSAPRAAPATNMTERCAAHQDCAIVGCGNGTS